MENHILDENIDFFFFYKKKFTMLCKIWLGLDVNCECNLDFRVLGIQESENNQEKKLFWLFQVLIIILNYICS